MKKKINYKSIIYLIVLIVFSIYFLFALEKDKHYRLERNILSFNTIYKDYLDDQYIDNKKELEKLLKDKYSSGKTITEYYQNIQETAFKKLEEDFLEQVYSLNLYRNMSTNKFSAENKANFDKAIKDASNQIKNTEDNYDIQQIKEIKATLNKINNIVKKEYNKDVLASAAFADASNNKNTTNIVEKNCFKNQHNPNYKFEPKISANLCQRLGLETCINVSDGNNNFQYGYTLNNPRKVNNKKNKHYEYVSYHADAFKKQAIRNELNVSGKEKAYVEVYSTEVDSKKIYKYNFVVLSDDYNLECKTPQND